MWTADVYVAKESLAGKQALRCVNNQQFTKPCLQQLCQSLEEKHRMQQVTSVTPMQGSGNTSLGR